MACGRGTPFAGAALSGLGIRGHLQAPKQPGAFRIWVGSSSVEKPITSQLSTPSCDVHTILQFRPRGCGGCHGTPSQLHSFEGQANPDTELLLPGFRKMQVTPTKHKEQWGQDHLIPSESAPRDSVNYSDATCCYTLGEFSVHPPRAPPATVDRTNDSAGPEATGKFSLRCPESLYIRVGVYDCICVQKKYIYTHTYVCIILCMYVCMYVCMHIYISIYIYIYIYIHNISLSLYDWPLWLSVSSCLPPSLPRLLPGLRS